MFFWFSKAIEPLLSPLAWALLLAAAGALLRRRRRAGPILLALSAAVLVVFSSDVVADRLMGAMERGARSTYRPDVVYDAVIVLGGVADAAASRGTGEAEMSEAVDRVLRGWELYRAGRARNLLLSGGLVWPQPGDVAEADRLAAKLAQWGVPPDRIAVERTSRNTRENAIESSRLAAARGWRTLLLVTSAAHMPRAQSCFKAVGLDPDVLPVDRRAGDGQGRTWLPRAAALAKSSEAFRELAGRIAYRLAGYAR
ncbi:MAG TPA: YdcF family protein [Anaeromyxobacter sp.]|nr:YdcF family protein [Anaeromyxobacter sp.]